jgi:hypothetical protein
MDDAFTRTSVSFFFVFFLSERTSVVSEMSGESMAKASGKSRDARVELRANTNYNDSRAGGIQ